MGKEELARLKSQLAKAKEVPTMHVNDSKMFEPIMVSDDKMCVCPGLHPVVKGKTLLDLACDALASLSRLGRTVCGDGGGGTTREEAYLSGIVADAADRALVVAADLGGANALVPDGLREGLARLGEAAAVGEDEELGPERVREMVLQTAGFVREAV